jgi:signal transduction histidine kinase
MALEPPRSARWSFHAWAEAGQAALSKADSGWHDEPMTGAGVPPGTIAHLTGLLGWTDPRLPVAILPVAVLVGVVAELSLANAGVPADGLLTDTASGAGFITAGLIAWRQRPQNRIGPIMTGIGLAWFGGDFLFAPVPLVGPLSLAAQAAARVLFAWLLLAFPSGTLGSAVHRWAVGVIGAMAGTLALLQLVTFDTAELCACPPNPFAVAMGTQLADQMGTVSALVGIAITIILVPLVVRRVVIASGPARRMLVPVLAGGLFSLLSVTPQLITDLTGTVVEPLGWLPIVWMALPLGFLVALLNVRMARGAVADLVIRLGETPEPSHLRDALAAALQDPTLEVLRWSPDDVAYLGPDGLPVTLPGPASGRGVTVIEGDRGRSAAIIHDPALLDDQGLVASVGAAMRLAVENERLSQEVRSQLEEVRASRTRIVEAADAERRRVERNLHDGAQQRLVALSLALRRARAQLPEGAGEEAAFALEDAADQLKAALSELRELARGIHPAILTEAGLGPALRALARDSPVPVTLELAVPDRLGDAIAAAVYYVAAEALTNVAKYAEANRVAIRVMVDHGDLTIEIGDDGRGGAEPATGSGLRGLADRVAAVGGRLDVWSPAGGGTRVVGRIPMTAATDARG